MEGKHDAGGIKPITFTGLGHEYQALFQLPCKPNLHIPSNQNISKPGPLKMFTINQKRKGFKMYIYMQTTCHS